jgi:hypothetical protein
MGDNGRHARAELRDRVVENDFREIRGVYRTGGADAAPELVAVIHESPSLVFSKRQPRFTCTLWKDGLSIRSCALAFERISMAQNAYEVTDFAVNRDRPCRGWILAVKLRGAREVLANPQSA